MLTLSGRLRRAEINISPAKCRSCVRTTCWVSWNGPKCHVCALVPTPCLGQRRGRRSGAGPHLDPMLLGTWQSLSVGLQSPSYTARHHQPIGRAVGTAGCTGIRFTWLRPPARLLATKAECHKAKCWPQRAFWAEESPFVWVSLCSLRALLCRAGFRTLTGIDE